MMFTALHEAGSSAINILRAATVRAAEVLGWQDRVGSIKQGYFADLVAVAGDPIADVSELQRARTRTSWPKSIAFTYVASRAELLASAAELLAAVQSGTVRINVNQRYPLVDVARAHVDLEQRRTTGSTVLLPQ